MWLYIPDNKPTSRSTPVAVDSISDSDSRIQMLSRSYTWNESYRQPRSWLTTLKRVYWMKHLFGLIPEPSTADRLLEKWIGSLGASHVSHSPTQEAGEEPMTSDGSGNTLGDWLLRYDPDTSSWRTPQVSLFDQELELYSENFPKSGTMRNGFLYEHRQSVRPIAGNASSSLLTNNWGTPNTMDSLPPKSQEALDRESSTVRKGRTAPNNLRDQVNVREGQAEWPTPSTQEYPHPGMVINEKGRREPKEGKTDHSLNLEDRASTWATPVSDEIKTGTHNHQGRSLMKDVDSFHHPPTTEEPGQKSSENDPTSHRRLNPKFVEWLMNLPERWIELHYLKSSETE